MNYNNRMPHYKRKVYEKRKVVHPEVKDGVTIFVEGPEPNPYEGVNYNSLKISSRIATGTFENHEGGVRQLEKAQGSDIMMREIEQSQAEFERVREANLRKKALEAMDNAYKEHLEEVAKSKNVESKIKD